ncbi:ferredoxin--NADP reductase [Segniliparus rugosus]|uniref:Uncharacterized protein n=1 Tax=Segniliparus rugosus (strain ATCC BAA-974 / DSM 45345 / CCUG 50838 / CIP 108380 / JCM 13579 / CDC 945) TaxID=679197 RepID=E5XP01_SEGRC|nr:ferredoxin--NADP reductase [Segniliparus rugosus]EFV13893.1 hypothetical protein HMPREF9336_01222 [Segniliparus rugosus ATCC BAA-974]
MNSHTHELTVFEVVRETADAVSLVFDIPSEIADKFAYSPGQFLTLKVPSEQTGSVARCYSLSSSPHRDKRLSVTVKRTVDGYASNWICDNAKPGAKITVLEPSGTFVPKTLDHDVLLFAGGSGVTPILSIVTSVLVAGTGKVAVVYANRDKDSVIFAQRLQQLSDEFSDRLTVLHWLESESGLPTPEGIAELARPYQDRDLYLCGPAGYSAAVREALAVLGVAPGALRHEEYISLQNNPFDEAPIVIPEPQELGDTAVVEVEFKGETFELSWPKETPLLDVLLAKGIDAPYVCRESACGTCVCTVKEGEVEMRMNESLIDEELEAGIILACQARPLTHRVRVAFDQ